MTDEPKTKTFVEEPTVAEVEHPTSRELASDTTTAVVSETTAAVVSETTTAIAPVPPSNGESATSAADANDSESAAERQGKAFDPFRFQRMTVPPGLRSEMAQAKLPRLSDEYFKETLPPATMKAASDPSDPTPETPDSHDPASNGPSDVPTVFEPSIERTPTSISLPISSTPRTIFWGGLGLLVGVILLFIARELTKDEPKLAMSPSVAPSTAPRESAASGSISVSPSPLPERTAPLEAEIAPTAALTAPAPAFSAASPAPSAPPAPASAALPARSRKPSGPTSASSSTQSPAPNTKRLWITPR